MARAYIALGANLGDRPAQLAEALRRLDGHDAIEVVSVSRAYESEPWGVTEQPLFANAVAVLKTALRGDELLGCLQDIERAMGRRPGVRYGPRPIDLDILLIGDEEWETPELSVPHPRMLERQFVVVPLLEVDPRVRMPDGAAIMRDAATEGRVTGVLGAIPGFLERTAPGEEWESIYERPGYQPVFSAPQGFGAAPAGPAFVPGMLPEVESNFAVVVLEQLGIPHVWDPFPPELSSDPYNLARPFRLLVPASRAAEAREALAEAADAEIQWDDIEQDVDDVEQ